MPNPFESYLNAIKGLISDESKAATPAISEETEYVEKDLDRELQIEIIKAEREKNRQSQQNREERKRYARHIFLFTCLWATTIFIILILSGLKCIKDVKYFEFSLSDKVLITLITSTTVNFFGFFLLVVKYLFNTPEKEKESKKQEKKPTKVVKSAKEPGKESE
jgi:hypothetical protein